MTRDCSKYTSSWRHGGPVPRLRHGEPAYPAGAHGIRKMVRHSSAYLTERVVDHFKSIADHLKSINCAHRNWTSTNHITECARTAMTHHRRICAPHSEKPELEPRTDNDMTARENYAADKNSTRENRATDNETTRENRAPWPRRRSGWRRRPADTHPPGAQAPCPRRNGRTPAKWLTCSRNA